MTRRQALTGIIFAVLLGVAIVKGLICLGLLLLTGGMIGAGMSGRHSQ